MEQKLYNVYLYTRRDPVLIVTDASKPHAVEQYIADRENLNPEENEGDFEYLEELCDDYITDVASNVPMESIEIASSEDFEDNEDGYVTYRP